MTRSTGPSGSVGADRAAHADHRPDPPAPSAALPAHHPLTGPDVEVLRLLARGLPLDTVARRLEISDRTVRRRCRQACDRLGVDTPIEAVVWAARHHLV